MTKLCLVMIEKNEERVIARALKSALPFIDCYSIVDTGSTDKSKEIITTFMGEHGIQGVIHDRPWVGFGHNRTEAIDLARERFPTKFGLILDADDTIEAPAGYKLPELTADQYDNPVPHGDLRSGQPHVIRLAMPFYFRGETHEYLDCKVPCVKSVLPEMLYRIGTDGNVRASGTKFKRDIELLLKDIRRNPKDTRSHFYLAQSYRDDGQLRPAFNTYLRRAELTGGWDEEVYSAKLEAAKLAEKLEMPEREIVGLYIDAYKTRPQRAEAMFYLGRYFRKAENYKLAILFADAARAIPRPDDRLFIESSIYDWHAQAEFAISAQRLGRHAEAIKANMEALKKCPRHDRAFIVRNLAFSSPREASFAVRKTTWADLPGWADFMPTYERYVKEIARSGDVVVEIGVFAGKSVAGLARMCLDAKLDVTIFGVDPWFPDDGDDDKVPQGPGGEIARDVAKHGGGYSYFSAMMLKHAPQEFERIHTLRCTSLMARRMFDDHSLAMVCIDGSHRYEDVRDDIAAWRTAVKVGGILCGDDYMPKNPGVMQAVNEAFGPDGFTVTNTGTWIAR